LGPREVAAGLERADIDPALPGVKVATRRALEGKYVSVERVGGSVAAGAQEETTITVIRPAAHLKKENFIGLLK
jgi:hypothetical protein